MWKAFAPLGYCGVLIHGSMLLVAATTAFIPRYALPIDPMLLIAGVLFADTIFAIVPAAVFGALNLDSCRHGLREAG